MGLVLSLNSHFLAAETETVYSAAVCSQKKGKGMGRVELQEKRGPTYWGGNPGILEARHLSHLAPAH